MDTIPSTHRITLFQGEIAGPGRATFSRTTAAANLMEEILSLLRVYNARVSRLSLTERASANLTTLHLAQRLDGLTTIIHHDSPAWATTTAPSARQPAPRIAAGWLPRPINPASKRELRDYARRKGIPARELWSRFPPSDAGEHAEMERELRTKPKPTLSPFETACRQAARKRKVPLTDAFRAAFRKELDELSALLGDLG